MVRSIGFWTKQKQNVHQVRLKYKLFCSKADGRRSNGEI